MSETTLPTEDLQVLFDAAVGSLDFGSGFLDNEEVLALRRVAVVLGVDPMKATPWNFNLVVATCEHDWEVNEKRWVVNPGVTVGYGGRAWSGGMEILVEDMSIGMLAQHARQGNVTGPEHTWDRRCRKCGCHE